jgi:hypothetical protein
MVIGPAYLDQWMTALQTTDPFSHQRGHPTTIFKQIYRILLLDSDGNLNYFKNRFQQSLLMHWSVQDGVWIQLWCRMTNGTHAECLQCSEQTASFSHRWCTYSVSMSCHTVFIHNWSSRDNLHTPCISSQTSFNTLLNTTFWLFN